MRVCVSVCVMLLCTYGSSALGMEYELTLADKFPFAPVCFPNREIDRFLHWKCQHLPCVRVCFPLKSFFSESSLFPFCVTFPECEYQGLRRASPRGTEELAIKTWCSCRPRQNDRKASAHVCVCVRVSVCERCRIYFPFIVCPADELCVTRVSIPFIPFIPVFGTRRVREAGSVRKGAKQDVRHGAKTDGYGDGDTTGGDGTTRHGKAV